MALTLAALVAVGGVSFAVGRLSAEGTGAASPAVAFSGAQARAAGINPAGDTAATTATSGTVDATAADTNDGGLALVAVTDASTATLDDGSTSSVSADQTQAGTSPEGRGQPPAGTDDLPTGGFGGGFAQGLQGTLDAVSESSMTLTLADGSSTIVATDASTTWVAQEAIEPDALQPGDSVTVQLSRGSPRAAAGDTAASAVAAQVTVTAPTD